MNLVAIIIGLWMLEEEDLLLVYMIRMEVYI